MIVYVQRYGFGLDSTAGLLFVDGVHVGYTCEDQRRAGQKVMHETCIPPGRYELKLRNAGGMNETYKERYNFHTRGMLHLQNVPNFEWIYIHVGNNDDHTSGCVLVGCSANRSKLGEYTVGRSVEKYRLLYEMIVAEIDRGEKIWVEVR